MGDTAEGPSGAAHSAQSDDDERQGFLARWFSPARAGEETLQDPDTDEPRHPISLLTILSKLRVDDVAEPRASITSVPVDIKQEDLVKVFRDSGYSRLPVYQDTLDNPLGLIHLKDLALRYGFNGSNSKFGLKRMLRKLLFAPPSMPVAVLMQKMQNERTHMALVIDEYGGVDGLVTMEDLIEQVVGEIADEHDEVEAALWTEEKPGTYLFQAQTPIEDFSAVMGEEILKEGEEDEIDTLGGLVFMLCGCVPARGEVIQHPSGLEFEIVDADPRKIKKLRVSHKPSAAE